MPYDIHPLKAADRDRAYALVRLMKPDVAIDHWQAFLDSALGPGASRRPQGVTVGTSGEGYLVGLYTWEVQPSLGHRQVLAVDNLIATGTLSAEPLMNELLGHIENQAAGHFCRVIQILMPTPDDIGARAVEAMPYVGKFLDNGFVINDHMLRKRSKHYSH